MSVIATAYPAQRRAKRRQPLFFKALTSNPGNGCGPNLVVLAGASEFLTIDGAANYLVKHAA